MAKIAAVQLRNNHMQVWVSLKVLITALLPALEKNEDFLTGVFNNAIDFDVILVVSKGVFELLTDPFDSV